MKEDYINMKIILIIKLMSLDKIKNKNQKSIDAYSKNTILNSLIKHKL